MVERLLENGVDLAIEEAVMALTDSNSKTPYKDLALFFLNKIKDQEYPIFESEDKKTKIKPKSVIPVPGNFIQRLKGSAKRVPQSVWGDLADSRTAFKYSLYNILSTDYPSHEIETFGVVVCDESCLSTFNQIFTEVCKGIHSLTRGFNSNLHRLRNIYYPTSELIKSIKIEGLRNLKEFPFACANTPNFMWEIYQKFSYFFGAVVNIGTVEADMLLQKYDTTFEIPNCKNQERLALMYKSFAVVEFEDTLIKLNSANHVEIVSRTVNDLRMAIFIFANSLNNIEGTKMFAFNDRYGFFTSSVRDLGTGLILTATLVKPEPQPLESLLKSSPNFKIVNDTLQLQVRSSLPDTEQDQINKFINCLKQHESLMSKQV